MSFHPAKGFAPITPLDDTREYYAPQKAKRGDPEFVMSRSELARFALNPAKWLAGATEEETQATEWGSLLDVLALTPQMFESLYAVEPEKYPGKKGELIKWHNGADYCREWRASQGDKTVISAELFAKCSEAAKSLAGETYFAAMREESQMQVHLRLEWRDERTGIVVPVQALVDMRPVCGPALADLKTTTDASYSAWKRTVIKYEYALQAAMYLDMANAAEDGDRFTQFVHHIQESHAPYAYTHRALSSDLIEHFRSGVNGYREMLHDYCACLASGKWWGYDCAEVELEPWMVK